MRPLLRGEKLHYFQNRPVPKILTAFFERQVGVLRAEIRVQLPSGDLLKKIVHTSQIERPREDRTVAAC